MNKTIALIACMALMVAFAGMAYAVPAGKTVEFAGGSLGKVVFDGKTHADKGNKCADCHPKIFQMKKGSTKIAAPHKSGEMCGTCHDGTKAFAQEGDNCVKCHKK